MEIALIVLVFKYIDIREEGNAMGRLLESKLNYKKVLKSFFIFFIPVIIIFICVFILIYNWQNHNSIEKVKIKQSEQGEILKYNVQNMLSSVISDMELIRQSNDITDYLENQTLKNKLNMDNIFYRFAVNKKIYNQVSFLDLKGKEISRTDLNNEKASVILEENLQYKGESYYFKEIKKCGENEIYVSPFDLNMENGSIEEPKKPIIRFGIPAYFNKEKKGYIVLSYFGQKILDQIKKFEDNNKEFRFILVNNTGGYIKSGLESKDWSFTNNKAQISLSNEIPDLWEKVKNNSEGYYKDNKNLYYFCSISPIKFDESDIIKLCNADSSWNLVISYPLSNLDPSVNSELNTIIVLSSITFLLVIIVVFIAAIINYYKDEASEKVELAFTVFENANEAILVTDEQTKIIYVNKSFTRITGFTKGEVLGNKTSSFKSGRHDRKFYEDMWNSISRFGRWQGEIWDRKKNGEIYPKFLTINTLKIGDKLQYIGVFQDMTKMKKDENHINKLRNYDTTTGLPNQQFFMKLLNRTLNKESNKRKAIISIIISNFNSINDILGVKYSKEFIIEVVNRISSETTGKGIVSRVAKDEFIVLINNVSNEDEIASLCSKILKAIKKPLTLDGVAVFCEASIGISLSPENSISGEELVELANIARNYVQEENLNSYKFYSQGLKENYLYYIKLESLLRTALEKEEFILQYQPQINIITGKVEGAEALIRWNSKELGRIPPDKFISIAEKTELIIPIGEWVIREAIKEAKQWIAVGFEDMVVSVNISPIQFKKSDIVKTIEKILNRENFQAKNLEIEITEGIVLENISDIKETLSKLKAMGVRIAIDDFGTGYSSLGYLRDLPFDKLKIDRQFIKDYPLKDDGTIAKIIIDLSHSLGLKVIAEGVETEEQLAFMKAANCDEIQGYYFSPPIDSHQYISYIQEVQDDSNYS